MEEDANGIPPSQGFQIFQYDADADQSLQNTASWLTADWRIFNPPLSVRVVPGLTTFRSWGKVSELLDVESSQGFLNARSLPAPRIAFTAWCENHLRGDVITPLKKFLDYVGRRWLRDGTAFTNFELCLVATAQVREQVDFWHTDALPGFEEEEEACPDMLQVATALLGPGTLFKAEGDSAATALLAYDSDYPSAVAGLEKLETRENGPGELVAFYPHNCKYPAVHRRPDFVGHRIFVRLILGTEEQIRRVQNPESKWL